MSLNTIPGSVKPIAAIPYSANARFFQILWETLRQLAEQFDGLGQLFQGTGWLRRSELINVTDVPMGAMPGTSDKAAMM